MLMSGSIVLTFDLMILSKAFTSLLHWGVSLLIKVAELETIGMQIFVAWSKE